MSLVSPQASVRDLRWAGEILVVAVLYFLTARLGLLLAMPGGHVTPVWPPSGIALAALLLHGRRVWWGIGLGSFAANFLDFYGGSMGLVTGLGAAVSLGGGASLAALTGEMLLRRYIGGPNFLQRVRDVGVFLVLGGMVSCLISATLGAITLSLAGYTPWENFDQIWLTWWLGDSAGVIVFAPLLLVWTGVGRGQTAGRLAELAGCFFLLGAVTYFVFMANTSAQPLAFVLIPALVWPAVRFRQRGAVLAVLVIALLAVWGTMHRSGPFALGQRNEALLLLELFLSMVVLTALCMAAMVTERDQAKAAQQRMVNELESRVRERTAALALSEEKFRTYVEQAADALFVHDASGRFLDVNSQACRSVGYRREELLQLSVFDLEASIDRVRVEALWRQAKSGETVTVLGSHRRKDGSTFPVEVRCGSFDRGGERNFISLVRDITERQQAEAALRQQESYHSKILDSVSDHIALLDEQGIIISVNRAWQQFAVENGIAELSNHWIGLSYLEVCARAKDYPYGDEAPQVLAALQKVLTGKLEQFQLEYPCHSPTERRWFLLTITRLAGAQSGAVMAHENITQSKEAKAVLQESEAKLRKVVDGFGPNVFVGLLSLDGRVLLANQSALAAAGLKHEDVLGRLVEETPWFAHSAASRQQVREAIRLAAKGTPSRFDLQIRGTDAQPVIWIDFSIQPFRDETDKVTYLVPSGLVITDRKAAEVKLRESEQLYATTLAAVNDGVWDWDLSSGDAYCSPLYYTMLGYADRAYPSNYGTWRTLVHPEDLDRVERDVQNSLATGRGFVIDMRMKTAAGAWCWVSSRGKTVEWDANGKALRMVGTLSDITARKTVETALQESEQKLRSIYETMAEGVALNELIYDANGEAIDYRILDVNPAFYATADFSGQQVIGAVATKLYGLPTEAINAFWLAHRQHQEVQHTELLSPLSHRWFLISTSPIVHDRFVTVFFDITARKQVEAALRESESALLDAQRVAQMGNWSWVIATDQVHWSAEMFRIYERDQASVQLSYEEQLKFYTAESAARLHAVVQRCIESGIAYELDLERDSSDGHRRWITARGEAIRDASGRIVELRGTAQDITARKQAEAALQSIDRRFRDLVDSTDGIVWEADAITFNFISVSNNAVRLLGYPVSDWLQSGFWASHIFSEDRDRALQYCVACTARVEDHDFEYRFVAADGRIVWLRDIVRVVSENNRPRWLRGLMVDITTQKEVSAALQISMREKEVIEDQLRQSQKLEALGTLAGGIAHDFNNILAGITGFNALARQAVGNAAELNDYLGEIDRASQRAAKLVQQILAFSRADNQTLVPTQIRHVVVEAVQLLRATLPSSIVFNVSLATDLPTVLGNATQLHQVVMNLGTNAGYAMREKGGSLDIRLETMSMENPATAGLPELPSGTCVQLTVSDTGCGMDAQTMRRVFDPFFTTKGPGEGTGLGLSVLHGIVRTHHGAIRLTSELGQGTTFTVVLPALVAATNEADVAPATFPLGQGQRILFVDDEAILTRLGALLLHQLGYVVESESSVQSALTRVERDPHAFDLVLTDQTMPGMSGLEFATRLHQLRPGLPVIIASGYSNKLTPQQIQAAGVKEVLDKPYTKESLATAIHRQLNKPVPE